MTALRPIRSLRRLLLLAALLPGAFACEATDLDGGLDTDVDVGMDDAGADTDVDTGTEDPPAVASGLPCEIDELLETRCRSCHGDPPAGGPMSLVTYADLMAPSPSDPSLRVAETALHRMMSVAAPMPPGAPLSIDADARAAWLAWLDAGTPEGECGGPAEPTEPTPPPTLVCSSGRHWDPDDDDGTPRMMPGNACITCHDRERLDDPDDDDIPNLLAGGTIYPTLFEPDNCYGLDDPEVIVILEGENGIGRVELTPNRSGNFLVHARDAEDLQPPFLVTIKKGDAERRMPIPAPHGNCNECHTATGTNGAPGRVLAP